METAPLEKNRIQQILSLHNQIVSDLKRSLDSAVQIGQLLTEQKENLGHGEFGPWMKSNLPFTDRTARNYMRCYRERDRLKTETVSDLKSAYKLLAEPKQLFLQEPKQKALDLIDHQNERGRHNKKRNNELVEAPKEKGCINSRKYKNSTVAEKTVQGMQDDELKRRYQQIKTTTKDYRLAKLVGEAMKPDKYGREDRMEDDELKWRWEEIEAGTVAYWHARLFAEARDTGWTQEEIAAVAGLKQDYIGQLIRFADFIGGQKLKDRMLMMMMMTTG